MENVKVKERSVFLDLAKGIVICLMVMGHCFSKANIINDIIYSFHMPFFFIVSGILKNRVQLSFNLKKFRVIKILKSTMIPYAIFEFCYCIFISILQYQNGFFHAFMTNFSKTILLIGKSATWFLPCLAIVKIIDILFSSANKYIYYVLALLSYVVAILLPTNNYWIVLQRAMIGFGFYAFGTLLSGPYKEKKVNYYLLVISFVLFVIFSYRNSGVSLYTGEFANKVLYTVNSIVGSVFFVELCKFIVSIFSFSANNVFMKLGKDTIIVLGTHMYFIEIFRLIDSKFFGGFLPKLGLFEGVLFSLIIMCIEFFVVLPIFNRYFSFVLGKPVNKRNKG